MIEFGPRFQASHAVVIIADTKIGNYCSLGHKILQLDIHLKAADTYLQFDTNPIIDTNLESECSTIAQDMKK